MRVFAIVGTRPEAIKMAPLILELRRRGIQTYLCSTAQHREMVDQVLPLFQLTPDWDLDLMRENQTPTDVTARVLLALDPVLRSITPDWVLVQGDTTSVMAAALCASHLGIPVGHVEAGLRTYDRQNPFPEEMNRVLTDHISAAHFAPTAGALENLLREGIQRDRVHVTGNTVIDAMFHILKGDVSSDTSRWFETLPPYTSGASANSLNPGAELERLLLVTVHRRENHGEPLENICHALRTLVEQRRDLRVVYPVHPNPNVWDPVHERLQGVAGIELVPPLDYVTLIHLMRRSHLILTDSGGIQEEAPSLGVPVLVLRRTTERPEAILAGAARLIGTAASTILEETHRVLDDVACYEAMARAVSPYGDGNAAARIADVLIYGTCDAFVPESSPFPAAAMS